jgi:hypothetical protein
MLAFAKSLVLFGYVLPLITARGLFEPAKYERHAARADPTTTPAATVSQTVTVQVPAVGVNAYFCEQLDVRIPQLNLTNCLYVQTTLPVVGTTTVLQCTNLTAAADLQS